MDTDYFIQKMHNCFNRNQKFITSEGVKTFGQFKDGEEVEVLDKDGNWRKATVHMYGEQVMNEVTFRSGRSEKTVICTPDHRWILEDESVTTSLKEGDRLMSLQEVSVGLPKTKAEKKAFAMGFAIGDGTDTSAGLRIRVCGEKKRYIPILEEAGFAVSFPPNYEGDAEARKPGISKQAFLNGESWKWLSRNEMAQLFLGLYAADGATRTHKIASADERVVALIEDTSAIAGYHIASCNEIVHDTNYKKRAVITEIRFRKQQPDNFKWKVVKIRPYRGGITQKAWCVEEPVTHSFTLDGGMVTGNCDLVNLEDMLQNGTVITGTLIEKPHTFYTACNITTQIVAQVASNQYGGQSFSLAHLAPFVDISRKRYQKMVAKEMEDAGIEVSQDKMNIIVEDRLRDEIKRGIQTIQYQLITLMTTNG